MSEKEVRQHPVCKYCKSENVTVDADARYNKDKNEWELSSVFDGGCCGDCTEEMKYFVWVGTPSTTTGDP